MQSDAIRELLEAASKGPWVAESNGWWHYIRTEDHDSVAAFEEYDQLLGQANVALAALAPDLAQEVLDLRGAGEALEQAAEAEERWFGHWGKCSACGATAMLCEVGAVLVVEATEKRRSALARWAELDAKEGRDE